MEPPPLGRRYSTISETTLARLESLETSFEEMTSIVDAIEAALADPSRLAPPELLNLKHNLAQLNGDLEKFQFTQVCRVLTLRSAVSSRGSLWRDFEPSWIHMRW